MSQPVRSVYSYADLWEFECCGQPLRVGDITTIRYIPFPPDQVFSPLKPIEWYVGHHDTVEPTSPACVRVVAVWEAFATLRYQGGQERYYAGQPGTGRLLPVERMTPRNPAWDRSMPEPPATYTPGEPEGWVMKLDVLED